MKLYSTNESGQVIEVSKFDYCPQAVHAKNKTVATTLLLAKAHKRASYTPQVRIESGAFLLVWHNGNEFIAESGTVERAKCPLCIAGHATESEALNDSTFHYYGSEAYRGAVA